MGLQLPHQLFHVPFTSGVVKVPAATKPISTWKVTLTVAGTHVEFDVWFKDKTTEGAPPL